MNLVSLVTTRRPSALGLRLILAIPGLAIVMVSLFGFVLFIAFPEAGTPGFFVRLVLGLLLGALLFVGSLRVRVSSAPSETRTAETPTPRPGARRAAQLFAIYLLAVGALELWGALSVRNSFRIGVATVMFASTLVLFGFYAYARAVKLQLPIRFGSLDSSQFFLAIALVPLIGMLYVLTSLPDHLP